MNNTQVHREVVKIGLDFRPISIDLGDGVVWEFTPDPSPSQWSALVGAIRKFATLQGKKNEDLVGGEEFEDIINTFTKALAGMLVDSQQQEAWVNRSYGLGPQQAVSEYLTETWSGFPTKEPSPSGVDSNKTG